MEDTGQVDEGAGHPGGRDPVDDGEVVFGKDSPPMADPLRTAVTAGPGGGDLAEAGSCEAGQPEKGGGRAVRGGRRRAGRRGEGEEVLLPGAGRAGQAVDAPPGRLPRTRSQTVPDCLFGEPAGSGLGESDDAVLVFGKFGEFSDHLVSMTGGCDKAPGANR